MIRRWTWLEGGHHLPSSAGKGAWLWCPAWARGEHSWGNPKSFGLQILLVAAGCGCLSCRLGRGTSAYPLGNSNGRRGHRVLPRCGWSGLVWAQGRSWLSSGGCWWADHWQEQGWAPLSMGFNEGYGLERLVGLLRLQLFQWPFCLYVMCLQSHLGKPLPWDPQGPRVDQHNFQASLTHFSFLDYLKISEAFAQCHLWTECGIKIPAPVQICTAVTLSTLFKTKSSSGILANR